MVEKVIEVMIKIELIKDFKMGGNNNLEILRWEEGEKKVKGEGIEKDDMREEEDGNEKVIRWLMMRDEKKREEVEKGKMIGMFGKVGKIENEGSGEGGKNEKRRMELRKKEKIKSKWIKVEIEFGEIEEIKKKVKNKVKLVGDEVEMIGDIGMSKKEIKNRKRLKYVKKIVKRGREIEIVSLKGRINNKWIY